MHRFVSIIFAILFLTACSFFPTEPAPPSSESTPLLPEERPEFCIEVYEPVCARYQIQCITTPCDPVWQTYSNNCYAARAGAFDIREGGTCEEQGLTNE